MWEVVAKKKKKKMSLAPPPLPPLVPVCLRSARAHFWTLSPTSVCVLHYSLSVVNH